MKLKRIKTKIKMVYVKSRDFFSTDHKPFVAKIEAIHTIMPSIKKLLISKRISFKESLMKDSFTGMKWLRVQRKDYKKAKKLLAEKGYTLSTKSI